MKILYIANIRLPTEKAHGIQIMKTCEAFANLGHKVELVVPRRFNFIKEDPFEYYGVEKNFNIVKLPSLDLVKFGRIGFWIQSFSFAQLAFFYSMLCEQDVVYSRDELPIYLLSFIKKNLFWESHTGKKNFCAKRFFKKNLKIIAISKGLKDFYIKNFKSKNSVILVAQDAVDLEKFANLKSKVTKNELGFNDDKKIIGYVGKYKTMGMGKGVLDIIKAMPKIIGTFPKAILMIVGPSEDEKKEIYGEFKKLSIGEDNFIIINHRPQREIPKYMIVSDVLVMNYPNYHHYAFFMSPMKLFEYMASGKPIIASDLPSIREVLNENNAVLVRPDSPLDLADGIIKILRDNDLSDRISKQATEDVKEYTWQKRAEKITGFIKFSKSKDNHED